MYAVPFYRQAGKSGFRCGGCCVSSRYFGGGAAGGAGLLESVFHKESAVFRAGEILFRCRGFRGGGAAGDPSGRPESGGVGAL